MNKESVVKLTISFPLFPLFAVIACLLFLLIGCDDDNSSTVKQIPIASIISPQAGASYVKGSQVAFDGTGTNETGGILNCKSLVWKSDIDGQIGTGCSFATNTLSLGNHVITLIVEDSEGGSAQTSIPIVIEEKPESTIANSFGMEFVYIEPGTFMMGSPADEPGHFPHETLHQVTLTQGYYMQITEVTQSQWKAVMGKNPSLFLDCGDDCPVEGVSWLDAQDFIEELNATGEGTYRLPTEAEWEYACRAGTTTAFANGEITEIINPPPCNYDPVLNDIGWYCDNANNQTYPVAQKEPNAWGLYDMHGNVFEWCQDWFGYYPAGPVTDPINERVNNDKILRGGAWYSSPTYCRSATRFSVIPSYSDKAHGVRLVLVPN
jgi:formylglycine-generating enzyme required for sulfatase activity